MIGGIAGPIVGCVKCQNSKTKMVVSNVTVPIRKITFLIAFSPLM